jgi:hypothetical protein
MHRRPERWSVTWWCDAPVAAFPLPVEGPLSEAVTIKATEGIEGS